jgi:hypothetical protein
MLGLLIAVVTVLIGIAVYQRARRPRSPKRGTERDVSPVEQGSGSTGETAKAQKQTNEGKHEIGGPHEDGGVHETPTTEATRNTERSDRPENHPEAGMDRAGPETPFQASSEESVCQGKESQQETEEARQLDPQSNQPQPAAGTQVPQLGAGDRQQAKGSSVELAQRGGRPRSTRDDSGKQSAELKSRQPKPEIVCWKSEWQWIPAVEVTEKFLEDPRTGVVQNGQPLTRDESREGCWRMGQISGNLVVSSCEEELSGRVTISLDENFILFKLSGENQNQGRRVRCVSCGSYLVICPDGWRRDETLSGPAPFYPEPVSLPGYRAHFFNIPKGALDRIVFHAPGGNSVGIDSKAPVFALVGNQLMDANEEVGPLFGGEPPRIRAIDREAWNNVETIVLGEEGQGGGKWRMTFKPPPKSTEQDLPPEVAARKGGWYFLRFYDPDNNLVESIEFRFLCALKSCSVLQATSPIPPQGGHTCVRVELSHDPGCKVLPANGPAGGARIERLGNKTVLIIPPNPASDETRWLVGAEIGPKVEVALLCERIWWAFGEEDAEPAKWVDKPLALGRQDFAATSSRAVWVRLPRKRWTGKILVGFKELSARSYPVKVTQRALPIPLRDFSDSEEAQNRNKECVFKIWVECDAGPAMAAAIAKIPADTIRPVEPPARPIQTVGVKNALCKGGTVVYGHCRNCRKKAAEFGTQ